MIRTVIVGGGMVGLTLARLLRARGQDPLVLERGPAGAYQPRGFMLGYQGFDAFEELGLLARMRAAGRDVGKGPDGRPVGIAVDVGEVMRALAEGVPVAYGRSVVALLREGDRVTGVVTEGPGGRAAIGADIVVACDGRASPVRAMAGLEAEVHPLDDAYLTYLSDVPTRQLFGFRYMSDGGMITMLGWPQGGTASRRIDRVGREAATAPDLERFRAGFIELLPEAEEVVRRIRSWDEVRYVEPALLRCPRWWTPGVVVIGDSAHVFGPDTGVGAGIGLQDAHALAEAIAREADADAACERYVTWREPAVRPYERLDPGWSRIGPVAAPPGRPAAEVWPPR
ncbi:FAD-dependent oxidoreductase [Miltoncostaea marina]|uniref:FAD-dependent oxidoreductase n=1 Tax=Miltoncostaea marina TaxID=2843215 RepID=UPI001C3CFFC6|nr:NAD(P)/FAD-dependent oxidoreductase [Miltoncostaea marina]